MAPTLPCDACAAKPCRAAFRRRTWVRLPTPVRIASTHALPPACPAPAYLQDRRELTAYVRSLGTNERAAAVRELAFGGLGWVDPVGGAGEQALLRLLSDAARPVLLPLPTGRAGSAVYGHLVRQFAFFSGSGGGSQNKEAGQAEVEWDKIEFERELEPIEVGAGEGKEGGGHAASGGNGKESPARETEKTRVTGLEGFCSHESMAKNAEGASQRIRRKVSAGKTLEVVPEFMKGDECSFVALGTNPGTPQWTVTLPNGSREGPKSGKEFKYTVPSVSSPAAWIPTLEEFRNLILGRYEAVEGCSPKLYTVTCRGENGERFSAGLKAYPSKTQKAKYDFGRQWKWLEDIINELGKGVKVFGVKTDITVKILVGSAWGEGGFKEDPKTANTFFQFKLGIGYAPVLEVTDTLTVPIEALLFRVKVPDRVREATLAADLKVRVYGSVEANLTAERETPGMIVGSGNIAGTIGLGFGGEIKVKNGKLFKLTAECSSTLKAQLSPVRKQLGDAQIYLDGFIESSGVDVTFKWIFLNGMFEPGNQKTNWLPKRKLVAGRIPLMAPPGSHRSRVRE